MLAAIAGAAVALAWLGRKGQSGKVPAGNGKGGNVAKDEPSSKAWPDLSGEPAQHQVIYLPEQTRKLGSRAWRNNNPGNLRYNAAGSIGHDAGGFAVFPDKVTGRAALLLHIGNKSNAARTLRKFFARYAPAADHNNPDKYAARVAGKLGVDVGVLVGSLSTSQHEVMADEIEHIEGWTAGVITPRMTGWS